MSEQLSSGDPGLIFGRSTHLCPYFMYASNEGFGKNTSSEGTYKIV